MLETSGADFVYTFLNAELIYMAAGHASENALFADS